MSSLWTNEQTECGNRKRQSQQNIVKLYGILWVQCSQALHSESMRDTKYEDVAEIYNIVWIMNKLKFLCAGVDSHITFLNLHFIPLRFFTWYVNRVVRWWQSILTAFNRHELMYKYPKETSPNIENCRKQKGMMATLIIQKNWRKKRF